MRGARRVLELKRLFHALPSGAVEAREPLADLLLCLLHIVESESASAAAAAATEGTAAQRSGSGGASAAHARGESESESESESDSDSDSGSDSGSDSDEERGAAVGSKLIRTGVRTRAHQRFAKLARDLSAQLRVGPRAMMHVYASDAARLPAASRGGKGNSKGAGKGSVHAAAAPIRGGPGRKYALALCDEGALTASCNRTAVSTALLSLFPPLCTIALRQGDARPGTARQGSARPGSAGHLRDAISLCARCVFLLLAELRSVGALRSLATPRQRSARRARCTLAHIFSRSRSRSLFRYVSLVQRLPLRLRHAHMLKSDDSHGASRSGRSDAREATDENALGAAAGGCHVAAPRARVLPTALSHLQVSFLCTVTFHANLAHSLTRSP